MPNRICKINSLNFPDELDSYMYQTVGHHAIDLYSEAMGLPLYRRTIEGEAVEQGMDYTYNSKDEVEDLYELLKSIMVRTYETPTSLP